MKRFIMMIPVALSLALVGCDPTGMATEIVNAEQIASQVQQDAQKVCSFVPTIETITGVLATFVTGAVPINTIASEVANAICNAVAPKAGVKRRALASGVVPRVNGVVIHGYFTR